MNNVNRVAEPYLYHIKDSHAELYVKFDEGRLSGNIRFKVTMDHLGIDIPPAQASLYNGKRKVYPTDGQLFEKAFRNIYFPLHLPKDEYIWKSELQ